MLNVNIVAAVFSRYTEKQYFFWNRRFSRSDFLSQTGAEQRRDAFDFSTLNIKSSGNETSRRKDHDFAFLIFFLQRIRTSSLAPVHKTSGAGLQQGATEDAHVILRAVARVRIISKFFWTFKFQDRLISAGSCASRSIPLAS